MERQAGVDDVLDDQHVAAFDARVEILEEPDRGRPACLFRRIAGQLDEVDVVEERQRARQVGDEDEARLQGADEQRLAAGVIGSYLLAELRDPRRDLLGGEIDLADRVVARPAQEASFRPYR
jgi:hypothetical protein